MSTSNLTSGFANPHPASPQIRDLIYSVAGIFHADNRLSFLEDRCARRMQELKIPDLGQYYDVLTRPSSRNSEIHLLLNEITVGETCFYRSQPQLAALQRLVLPSIVTAKEKSTNKHLRIWSAGCSSGEEPYTLAMILMEEASRLLRGFTFEVLATDLNDRSLQQAEEAIYGGYALRNVRPEILHKYFEPVSPKPAAIGQFGGSASGGTKFHVRDEVRQHVKFSRINLLDDSRMLFFRSLDVIFCCNVLIYFDVASKKRVIQHFYNNLLPHSHLFLGHAESLFGIHDGFQLVHFPGALAYVKAPVQR